MASTINLTYNFKGDLVNFPQKGKLASKYSPLHNLLDDNGAIKDFRTENLEFNVNNSVDIKIQDSYDGSCNIIMTDDTFSPKLVNSRFSVAEDSTYIIPDHIGNKDTNLYKDSDLSVDTYLQKTITKLPELTFEGLSLGGKLLCGSYHFYFKFCDNDSNETDFVAESGVVMVHIGNINDPFSIRMGMENEQTDKCVRFKISNIDGAYDFVKVYYTRSTSGADGKDITEAYEIIDKFPILDYNSTDIIIYGTEKIKQVDDTIINQKFEYVSKAKSQAICLNRLFLGNIYKPDLYYEDLQELSLLVVPKVIQSQDIGALNNKYTDYTSNSDNAFGYYNAKNIYYRLGYWPEEYYRFGIVYIMNDYTLSPVFNVRGVDFIQKGEEELIKPVSGITTYSEDGYILDSSGKENRSENNFGVVRIDKRNLLQNHAKPISIKFSFLKNENDLAYQAQFEKLSSICKGFFIVRQKRIPITLAQGMVIGKTKKEYGNLPVLKYNNQYFSESFLSNSDDADINTLGSGYVTSPLYAVENKAVIVPDAILLEPLFNLIFVSKDCKYNIYAKAAALEEDGFGFNPNSSKYTFIEDASPAVDTAKFTMVNSGMKLTTNGTDYFSAKAGEAESIKLFESVDVNWHRLGRYQAESTRKIGATADKRMNAKRISLRLSHDRLVRGIYNTYVGMSDRSTFNLGSAVQYGNIINIKDNNFDEDSAHWFIEESIRKADTSPYYAVSDRLYLNQLNKGIECYRGDCFICNYSHRMMSAFIDPEVPTNEQIVDTLSWNDNFLVMTKFKSTRDGTAYYINEALPLFKAKKQSGKDWLQYLQAITTMLTAIPTGLNKLVAENWVAESEGEGINWEDDLNSLFIVLPSDSKYNKLGQFGETIGIPNTWYEFGLEKISRSDVNSVGLGHWVTFKVLSNINICMRDEDHWRTEEETIMGARRSFYPLRKMSRSAQFKAMDSNKINGAANKVLSDRYNIKYPDIPYIKQQYDTRLQFSDICVSTSFGNGFRVFRDGNFVDLPKTYGCLTNIIEWQGNIVAIMEHGVLMVPINERILSGNGAGGDVYTYASSVIGQTPAVLSATFGSTWKDSIIQTENYIYGVDTCAKKIWRTDGRSLTCISDFHLQKFLNDNIELHEWEHSNIAGIRNVKTHFNDFKKDVMFTFYNDDKEWNICWNEYLEIFTTFYTWTPSFSDSINNIYLSFDIEDTRNILTTGTEMLDKYYEDSYDSSRVNLKTAVKNAQGVYTLNTNYLLLFKNNVEVIDSDFEKYPDNMFFEIVELTTSQYKYALKFNELALEMTDDILKESGLDLYIHVNQEQVVKNGDDIVKVRIKNPMFDKAYLWKHGKGGLYDGEGIIKPTNWYGKQHPFELEFVVQENPQIQKIFNNLMIISNKTQPEEFSYELVGESYEWYKHKPIIDWINDHAFTVSELRDMYKEVLSTPVGTLATIYEDFPGWGDDPNYIFRKLPYIRRVHKKYDGQYQDGDYEENSSEVRLVKDDLLSEERITVRQKCNNIKQVGRIKGNSEYKEDCWRTEIRYINFKNAYLDNTGELRFTKDTQTRLRDKYIKIKVRYSGTDLAVIQAIKTIYSISYG